MTPTNEAGHGLPAGIIERLAAAKDQLPRGSDERNAVWQAIEYLRTSGTGALSRGVPETGSWIAADDVYRHARTIDVALNGEDGAARRPALCDVVAQIASLARQHGPLAAALAAPAAPAAAGAQGEEYQRGYAQGVADTQKSPKYDSTGDTVYAQPAAADGGVRERAREILAGEVASDYPKMARALVAGKSVESYVLVPHCLRAIEAALSSHRQAGDESKFRELAEEWKARAKEARQEAEEETSEVMYHANLHQAAAYSGCAYALLALVEKGAGS